MYLHVCFPPSPLLRTANIQSLISLIKSKFYLRNPNLYPENRIPDSHPSEPPHIAPSSNQWPPHIPPMNLALLESDPHGQNHTVARDLVLPPHSASHVFFVGAVWFVSKGHKHAMGSV